MFLQKFQVFTLNPFNIAQAELIFFSLCLLALSFFKLCEIKNDFSLRNNIYIQTYHMLQCRAVKDKKQSR